MFRKVAIIGLLVIATLAAPAWARLPETPRLRQLTVADGLPAHVIHALAGDRSGYLWIGTADGLARYAGVGFRVWREEDGLPANAVSGLYVDADDRLWVATTAGLVLLDREHGRFHRMDDDPESGEDRVIWSVTGTGDGSVWFGTGGSGLYRIGPDGRRQRFMPDADDPRSLPSASVALLATDHAGTLWAGTRGGLARWTGDGFETVPGLEDEPLLLWLAPDRDGRLWVGTPGGAGVVGADGRFSRSLPWQGEGPYARIYSVLLRDSSGQYWLESFGGLAMGRDGRAEVVGTYSELRQGRIKPAWSAAHEDREGGLWLGSADAGLWYLAPSWRQFSRLLHDPDDPRTPANVDVTAIAPAADGGMWTVGNSGALDWLDPGSGHFRHVYSDTGDYVPEVVLEDDAGSVWIGFHAGLARFDRAGGAMHMWQADHPPDPAPDGRVVALVQAAEGLVWAVTAYDGVQARDREGRVRERV